MVFLTSLKLSVSSGTRKFLRRKFLDSLRLHVTGGSGGMGHPKYGGFGGDGGSIYIVGKEGISLRDTIKKIKEKKIKAQAGIDAHKNCIVGPKGDDVFIEAPVGITVFSEQGLKLGEINKEDEQIVVAKGGSGGNKTNDFSGRKGESRTVVLDLKIIADIGLVGFPNAGKSTILSLLSNAKPKIASYPFTTIHPNIGLIEYPDFRTISMADLPGLIEGSHVNCGMGHKFLKHVERTKVLLVVVDISGFKLGHKYKSRSCLETVILLNKELELYREDLLDKPAVLVINKMDKLKSSNVFKDLSIALQDYRALLSSVPEPFRPLRPLCFERTICMTAKDAKTEEIELLKSNLREVLDLSSNICADEELSLAMNLEKSQKIRGPLLV